MKAAKINVLNNFADYAKKKGYRTADIPMKDGSIVRVFDNFKDTIQFFHCKGDNIAGWTGYKSENEINMTKYFLHMCDRIAQTAKKGEHLASNILDQLLRCK